MNEERLAEIEDIVNKSDISWFGKYREKYTRNSDGNYELEDTVIDDLGNIDVDEIQELIVMIRAERDKHQCTLNVLESTVRRFDEGVNMNVLVDDIREYLKG